MDILLNINTALTTTLHNDMLLIKKDFNIPAAAVYPRNSLCCRFQKVGNE